MKSLLFPVACALVVFVAAWVRLADLSLAPFHFDEAVQARIAASWLGLPGSESQALDFNPRHFHGPLPVFAAVGSARLAGENSWQTLTKATLRVLPALSGVAVVLGLLMAAPLIGSNAAIWAAAFAAVSPFLVHYNRLFIHENLLALFLVAALLLLGLGYSHRVPIWTVGICLGLAAATKETFVLTPVSWAIAGVAIYHPQRDLLRRLWPQILGAGLAFFAVIVVFYSVLGNRPGGVWDFVSTYWSYQTGAGHEKPPGYYAQLFLLPSHYGRLWWWQGGIFLLAVFSLFQKGGSTPLPAVARFCFLSGLLQAGVYSLLPYKTPWLMLVPWLHFLIAAGIGAAALLRERMLIRMAAGILLTAWIAFQGLQTWRVAFRYPSDARNPFAYVPTAPGVEAWTRRSIQWLESGNGPGETVGVIGPHYWPLPWYFRNLPKVGYWPVPPDDLAGHALVVAMPEFAGSLADRLSETHVAIPEGLRTDTPVLVFVRKDIWEKNTQAP